MTADILELPGLFVSGDWLLEHLDDPRLVLLDAKPSEYPGESSGILPGARHIELRDLSDPSSGLSYTLAHPERLAAGFAAVGVGDDSTVVAYDHGRGSWGALIGLRLRAIGFDRVAVLDGGPRAWAADGHPYVDSYRPRPSQPVTLTVRPHPELHAQIDQVQVAAAEGQLVANLPPDVFAGERSPLDRPGHIPGSTNIHQIEFVDARGLLLGHDELRSRFAAAGVDVHKPVITYCNAGISAALGALVLNELGNRDVAVFDGGLEEWNADPERPVGLGEPRSVSVGS
ncbi:MAG: rhodanese-like domain-containing protein [Solirubrobacteraceae bacterium]